ncbi:FGGY-family carbohydrate kinase [Streptodolium elevatio]|uniref:FGGY family carbohydrate kinase n=1 Tax=Streptodolium elevatio TaxID=3157996 RepID=A0ABV3DEK1_9ACTN
MGVDLGTQGVRALAVTADGRVLGRGSAGLTGHREGNRHQQLPADWWSAVGTAVRRTLAADGTLSVRVRGLSVCSTSGTVLLTSPDGAPVGPALMYDDGRAEAEAGDAQEAGAALWDELGLRIQPSWALAKLVWLARHADQWSGGPRSGIDGSRVCHQADYVVGRLAGHPVATDSSHALKTGYDLHRAAWPTHVHDRLGLDGLRFPDVVPPGTVLGTVCRDAAAHTGLTEGTPIVAGMTDGCAAQLGSGAWGVGQWNSVLGTTLVLKGVTATPLRDPAGVLYNHRSPDGHWLPGGASSVGAGALTKAFPGADLARLDRLAVTREPARAIAYPLVAAGERFPFLAPDAEAFMLGSAPEDDADRHAALLQGVALVERLCLAYIRLLGAPVDAAVTFTGGATRSPYWNQLRADILGRPAIVPEQTDPALGMAVLAAHGIARARAADGVAVPLASTSRGMVRTGAVLDPRPDVTRRFAEPFAALVGELERRGWLPRTTADYAREHG